jgi:Flp pilus assembly protein TadG
MVKTIREWERGGAIVEFAVTAPVMVLLFLGTVFFGLDFHMYNRLEESVRAGARYGSMLRYDAYSGADPSPTRCTSCTMTLASGAFLNKIQNIVAYGCDPSTESSTDPGNPCTTTPIVEGNGPSNVKVTLGIVNWAPASVTVSIINLPVSTPFGKLNVSGKPATTFQYAGVYWPACVGCK